VGNTIGQFFIKQGEERILFTKSKFVVQIAKPNGSFCNVTWLGSLVVLIPVSETTASASIAL
jgi:hypothetical protein